ncbi:MAG TPA: glycosyltransferase [Longimicrobiales bacterium]|jgi:glycosyltransferase involved in cell wall biosynthesis
MRDGGTGAGPGAARPTPATLGNVRRARVYGSAGSAGQGGGVFYALAVAEALAGTHETELLFSGPIEAADLRRVFGMDSGRLHLGVGRVPRGLVGELVALAAHPATDVTVIHGAYVPRLPGRGRTFLLIDFPLQRTVSTLERLRLRRCTVLANSAFTAEWIQRRWGVPATVLHPPARTVTPAAKERIILSVGRFHGGARSKRQLEMVAAFRQLRERDGTEGWRLHLVGSAMDHAYVETVRAAARDLPVELHLDLPAKELDDLYGRASLYWHATGLGIDEGARPENVEHFGITTVEAMSAGAVPVVIRKGGQPEILGDPPTGLLWDSVDELVEGSVGLIRDPGAREDLAGAARRRARAFDLAGFPARVREAMELAA